MAECSLAVTFANLRKGIDIDRVNGVHLSKYHIATEAHQPSRDSNVKELVNCGAALPGYEVEIRDGSGKSLPDRHCGTLFVKGPSVMSGYFGEIELTREVLSEDGWLNTGDLAYRVGDNIVITGREKDLIIINGRNVWPQDLEYLAESQPEVRTQDASAFSVTDRNGQDAAILVIECRESDAQKREELVRRVQGLIRSEHGIECCIELVPRNTLPRTTSGKLSRSGAKKDYLKRVADGQTVLPGSEGEVPVLHRKAV
jgi:fatty-acyl-CoA synthase